MNTKQPLTQQQRKQRFLLVLPLLVLPFLTMIFWALGGGTVANAANTEVSRKGINNNLPGAQLKSEEGMDKLSFYDRASKDSALLKDQQKTDPNYMQQQAVDPQLLQHYPGTITSSGLHQGLNPSPYSGGAYNDPNEAKIYQRLNQLNQALSQPEQPTATDQRLGFTGSKSLDEKDVDRLEQMMQQMQSGSGAPDPEMDQLNGMLEKIMDIQNPERVQQKLKQVSEQHKGNVYAVATGKKREMFSLLEQKGGVRNTDSTMDKSDGNGFYSLDDAPQENQQQNTIDAVVHETQTIVNGSTVKLRLLNDIYVNGKLIPKDNFVFGTAALNGERLGITITGVRYKKSLFPVALSIVDVDGMDGIYIPGAISRDVAKQSADQAIQQLTFGSMSNSIGIQAAGTGLEAAKSLFSKKVKLIKVTVKAGYKVLLRDDKQKNEN